MFIFIYFLGEAKSVDNYIYIKKTNIEDHLLNPKQKINMNNLDLIFEKVITYYENAGYPFSQISLENIEIINKDSTTADLILKKGKKYTIDSFAIYSKNYINKNLIFKILDIYPHDIYNHSIVSSISQNLKHSEFFSETKTHDFVYKDSTIDIYMYIEKNQKNSIDALIGVLNNENSVEFTGFANVNLKNITNFGDEIKISWNRNQKNNQQIKSEIIIPYIIKSKLGYINNLHFFKQTNDFSNITIDNRITFKLNNKSNIKLGYLNKKSVAIAEQFSNSKQNSILLGFFYDVNKLIFDLNSFYGSINSGQKKSHIHYELKSSYEYKLNNRLRIESNLIIEKVICEKLKINEALFLGGKSNLRGFNENEFLVTEFGIFTNQVTYQIDQELSTFLFVQHCYFKRNIIDLDKTINHPKSFGFGLALLRKNNKIYFEYAFGKLNNQPINFSDGKIHIGIENNF